MYNRVLSLAQHLYGHLYADDLQVYGFCRPIYITLQKQL